MIWDFKFQTRNTPKHCFNATSKAPYSWQTLFYPLWNKTEELLTLHQEEVPWKTIQNLWSRNSHILIFENNKFMILPTNTSEDAKEVILVIGINLFMGLQRCWLMLGRDLFSPKSWKQANRWCAWVLGCVSLRWENTIRCIQPNLELNRFMTVCLCPIHLQRSFTTDTWKQTT